MTIVAEAKADVLDTHFNNEMEELILRYWPDDHCCDQAFLGEGSPENISAKVAAVAATLKSPREEVSYLPYGGDYDTSTHAIRTAFAALVYKERRFLMAAHRAACTARYWARTARLPDYLAPPEEFWELAQLA